MAAAAADGPRQPATSIFAYFLTAILIVFDTVPAGNCLDLVSASCMSDQLIMHSGIFRFQYTCAGLISKMDAIRWNECHWSNVYQARRKMRQQQMKLSADARNSANPGAAAANMEKKSQVQLLNYKEICLWNHLNLVLQGTRTIVRTYVRTYVACIHFFLR